MYAPCGSMQDLDLTKRGVRKFTPRDEFEVTTKEVLRKADFRVCALVSLSNICM